MRITTAVCDGEEMAIIEVLRTNGSVVAYPITTDEARRMSGNLQTVADAIDGRNSAGLSQN